MEAFLKEQIMMEICENIGNYIDIELEELEEKEGENNGKEN